MQTPWRLWVWGWAEERSSLARDPLSPKDPVSWSQDSVGELGHPDPHLRLKLCGAGHHGCVPYPHLCTCVSSGFAVRIGL